MFLSTFNNSEIHCNIIWPKWKAIVNCRMIIRFTQSKSINRGHGYADLPLQLRSGICWSASTAEIRDMLIYLFSWDQEYADLPLQLRSGICWSTSTAEIRNMLIYLYSWDQEYADLPLHLRLGICWSISNTRDQEYADLPLHQRSWGICWSTSTAEIRDMLIYLYIWDQEYADLPLCQRSGIGWTSGF